MAVSWYIYARLTKRRHPFSDFSPCFHSAQGELRMSTGPKPGTLSKSVQNHTPVPLRRYLAMFVFD